METVTAIIRNWYIFGTAVWGEIYNDSTEKWEDGHVVKLSRPKVKGAVPESGCVYETMNSKYYME